MEISCFVFGGGMCGGGTCVCVLSEEQRICESGKIVTDANC